MPIRGDRLRWPPRPGRRSADARRSPSTEKQQVEPQQTLRQADERAESARSLGKPRAVINQAHDDIESGQEDTDCRVHAAEVLDAASKTREKPAGDS